MMVCSRCGIETARLTLTQRRCPPCEAQVKALIEADAKRRAPRWPAKDLSGLTGVVL